MQTICSTTSPTPRYKVLNLSRYKSVKGTGPTLAEVESDLVTMPHLDHDIRFVEATDSTCIDVRKCKAAIDHLQRLPDAAECIHLVTSGSYRLWDTVTATLHLSFPYVIEDLYICTLGFSIAVIDELCELLDTGKVARVMLTCSHYFKGTSKPEWQHCFDEFAKRPQARFVSIRNHAKLLCMALSDGRRITVEGSANLRSCKNIEQATVFGSPAVFDFHVAWMKELTAKGDST